MKLEEVRARRKKSGRGLQREIHARKFRYSCFGDLHEGDDCHQQPAGYLWVITPMAGRTSTHAITSFQKQGPAQQSPKVSLECEAVESEACPSRCVPRPGKSG